MTTLTTFVLFGLACFAVGLATGYFLRPTQRWVMDDGDTPPPEEPPEEDKDLSEADTEEIKRIRDGFGESVYIAMSPLIKFRNPLDVANIEFNHEPVPVVNGHHHPNGHHPVKLGLWDTVQFAVAMLREPPTIDMNPYRGKHRADGRTAHDIENLNTQTQLIPLLEYTKPGSHTMDMPWREGELVFA